MSTLERMLSDTSAPDAGPLSKPPKLWQRLEAKALTLSDRLNPIVVKEARQALKSRQFMATFILLLTAAWIWSILGVALIGPSIYYSAEGPGLFYGYYVVLAFPLLVVVPFGAFRSMAAEMEDRTYELIAITSLSARQIVTGKLAAAVLQMVVYLSAVSPCLAFTYLLRGIDILTILMVVVYTALASLAFSLVALLFSTGTAERYQQVLVSVLLICGLVMGFFFAMGIGASILSEGQGMFTDRDFWIANAAMLTAYVSYFVLLLLATAGQLTETSRNRSTPLRIVMLIQHALLTGWMAYAFIYNGYHPGFLVGYVVLLCLHWFVMGALMTGESSQLSPRAKRSLPQTLAGRAFLTWLNPGPATGYVFAVTSAVTGGILVMLAVVICREFWKASGITWNFVDNAIYVTVLSISYLAIYLGLGKLVLDALRRVIPVGLFLRFAVQVLLVLVGTIIPLAVQLSSRSMRNDGYSLLQITNCFWTVSQFMGTSAPTEKDMLVLLLPAAAILVLLANAGSILKEVGRVRVAPPERVAVDNAEIEAVLHPAVEVHTSPWD